MTSQLAEDLVFIHTNLHLISKRRSLQYCQGETKMWGIARDKFYTLDDVGMLELTNLLLKPEIKVVHLLMIEVMTKVMVTWWKLSQPDDDLVEVEST